MRSRFLGAFVGMAAVACATSSELDVHHDNDAGADASASEARGGYDGLFDDAIVPPTEAQLEGLWELQGTLPAEPTAVMRMRFEGQSVRMAVRWSGRTFGVTVGYQLQEQRDDAVEIVVARDSSVKEQVGEASLELLTIAGTRRAQYQLAVADDFGKPVGAQTVEFGALYATRYVPADAAETSQVSGGVGSFKKIGD